MINKRLRIEAIPDFAVKIYSWIAKKSPCIRDMHQEIAQEVCAKISAGRLLDIGTGPGYVPFEIAERSPNLEITGIDLSAGMVELANENARKLGLAGRVNFKLANAGSLPFENEYFDFIISTLSLHHWACPVEYMKEIRRVLKTGGQIYIYDIWKDTPKQAERELRHKYGWFLAFLFLRVVRWHSSITSRQAQEIISALGENFTEKSLQPRGILLKLQFLK